MELRLHPEPAQPRLPVAGAGISQEAGLPWAGGGAVAVEGVGPSSLPVAAAASEAREETAAGTWAGRGRQTCLTSRTPNAVRPPTSKTGARSPSPSSPCSRAPTTPPATATATTRTSSPRTPTASSGSSRAARPRPEKLVRDWPAVFV